MREVIKHLKKSKRILAATHVEPDGDALGSLIAFGLALKETGIDVKLYCESPTPAIYRFLPSIERVGHHTGKIASYETAVILDCGTIERVGDAAEAISRIPEIINIDHHVTNNKFGSLQLVDNNSCATAAIIYRLIEAMGIHITREIAFAIYTGILTDTGSFRFPNTNRDSFGICGEMVSYGVDPSVVAENVYGTYSLSRLKLLNLALDSIEISKNGKLSIMTVTESMLHKSETRHEDIDGLINYAKNIESIKVAVLIQEYPTNGHKKKTAEDKRNGDKHYHISLRSDGTVDVAQIAAIFNGGGHPNAAGFDIESDIFDLKKEILSLAENL